jgi:hypothetical protein
MNGIRSQERQASPSSSRASSRESIRELELAHNDVVEEGFEQEKPDNLDLLYDALWILGDDERDEDLRDVQHNIEQDSDFLEHQVAEQQVEGDVGDDRNNIGANFEGSWLFVIFECVAAVSAIVLFILKMRGSASTPVTIALSITILVGAVIVLFIWWYRYRNTRSLIVVFLRLVVQLF